MRSSMDRLRQSGWQRHESIDPTCNLTGIQSIRIIRPVFVFPTDSQENFR